MKNFIFLLLLFVSSLAFCTVRRVNNIPGVVLVPNLVYATFSAALVDASDGDTIYLEPSLTTYSSANISKRIVLIGNGYQLSSNESLVSPISGNKLESKFTGFFDFANGSSNSKVFGVVFSFSFTIKAEVSGVLLNGCRLEVCHVQEQL